jgi:antitoxin ParD1/3/4
MHVSLTPRLEALIREKVESGLYGNASEVVREALRMMELRDRDHQRKVDDLRAALIEGEESGFVEDFDMSAFMADLDGRAKPKA